MRRATRRGAEHGALGVVAFSGGRGSRVLSSELVRDPRIRLTLAINGYDDGASTGEVRRFLGDCLGPSDFRKNASWLASATGSCSAELVALLDGRLTSGTSRRAAVASLGSAAHDFPVVAEPIEAFLGELSRIDRPFEFSDCCVGNVVFAGAFLLAGRDFNAAIDDYCARLGLRPGLIENVTDGVNAHLVAIADDGSILGSEAAIVDATAQRRIGDIYLIDRALSEADSAMLAGLPPGEAADWFEHRRAVLRLNQRLETRIADADVIIYAPGTQYSSLFPSYLTPGLSQAIARNLGAVKLLITNLQIDAEIAGSSAVDIIERAAYYLSYKSTLHLPTPCFITHSLVNDPGQREASAPYVPLGQIDTLEDPRLVRVANYEDSATGRHDAAKILMPLIRSLLGERRPARIAVHLHDARSPGKVAQSLLEMVRGGLVDLRVELTVFYDGEPLDPQLLAWLPMRVEAALSGAPASADARFRRPDADGGFDYVLLFDSSGVSRGEDIVGVASRLASGRLDAVWGSRRLSVRDIEESIHRRYRGHVVLGLVSRFGSHLLSLACLVFYGRYVSDTLSPVRAVRIEDARAIDVPLTHPRVNQHLLVRLLRRKADILEVPVQFFPMRPGHVGRPSIIDGLRALRILAGGRLVRLRTHPEQSTGPVEPVQGDKSGEEGV